jgi:hypothetical protein
MAPMLAISCCSQQADKSSLLDGRMAGGMGDDEDGAGSAGSCRLDAHRLVPRALCRSSSLRS